MQLIEKTITVSRFNTVFLEGGEGETVVWIPGWGASGKTYLNTLTELSKKFHVFAPDLPGFGKADTPKKIWGFSDYAAFIREFMRLLSLKQVILIGHSTGGAVALHTVTQSDQIKQLVLIDPYGLPLEQSRIRLVIRYLREFLVELHETSQIKSLIQTSTNLYSISRNIRYVLPYSLHIFSEQLKNDTLLFTKVSIPTLVMWGENDAIFGKDYAKTIKKALPMADMIKVPGTHNWILFRPQELLKHL